MSSNSQESSMKKIDIMAVDINELKDIKDITIDKKLGTEERMKEFVRQIKNPYCFKYGNLVVQITHKDTDKTINDCLREYILSQAY